MNDNKVIPSGMEHFETCMRDPIFYQFYKRILSNFLHFKEHRPHYKHSELLLPGVKIEDVHVDKLITYMDHFDWDITNALYMNEDEFMHDTIEVRARQMRLNHKPFTVKITADSEKEMDVMVKIFLGPKRDEQGHKLSLKKNWMKFIMLDKFHTTLQSGKNTIVRNSADAHLAEDRTTYRHLYKKVMSAIKGEEEFHVYKTEAHNQFPMRFMLPMGKKGGMEYQMFVFIYEYKPMKDMTGTKTLSTHVSSTSSPSTRTMLMDKYPMGYPLNRFISDELSFLVPNSFLEDVTIYHKTLDEIQKSHE